MKRLIVNLLAVAFVLGVSAVVLAAASDTITVNYEVQAINEINIDDADVTLTVSAATAGAQPTQASDSATYDITTNCAADAKKLTAKIDTAMAAGLTLQIDVTAPTDGTSPGATTMTATAADVVTAIDPVAQAGIAIGFTLDATVAAGVVGADTKTLTLTLTDTS